MKKFILSFLMALALAVTCFAIGCVTENPNNNNNNNNNNGNVEVSIDDVVFGQTEFVYAENTTYSIEIVSIPEGMTYTDQNNGQSQVGTYTVTFTFYVEENGTQTVVGTVDKQLKIIEKVEVELPWV